MQEEQSGGLHPWGKPVDACALQVLVIDSDVLLQLLSSRGFSSPYLVNSML